MKRLRLSWTNLLFLSRWRGGRVRLGGRWNEMLPSWQVRNDLISQLVTVKWLLDTAPDWKNLLIGFVNEQCWDWNTEMRTFVSYLLFYSFLFFLIPRCNEFRWPTRDAWFGAGENEGIGTNSFDLYARARAVLSFEITGWTVNLEIMLQNKTWVKIGVVDYLIFYFKHTQTTQ